MKQVFWSENWSLIESGAWLFDTEHNILYYADFDSRTMKCVSEIPVIKKGVRQFSYIYATKEKVYLLPEFDNRIMVYEIDKDVWTVCEEIRDVSDGRIRCSSCWRRDNYLVIYASNLKSVMFFDLARERITDIVSINCERDDELWEDEVVLCEINVYVPSRISNRVYVLDVDRKKTSFFCVGSKNSSLRTITNVDEELWISDNMGKLIIVDKHTMGVKSVIEVDEEKGIKFGYVCYLNGKVWLVPSRGSSSIYYIEGEHVNKMSIPDEEMDKEEMSRLRYGGRYTVNYIRENRYIGIYSFKTSNTIEIDTISLQLERYKYKIVEGVEIIRNVLLDNALIEMNGFGISELIEII